MQHLLPGRDILLLNLVGSTESFVVLALSAPIGRLLDAGHSRGLLITGACLVGPGYFLLSLVNGGGGYAQGRYGLIWLTQGLITGLGMSCFFVSSSQSQFAMFKSEALQLICYTVVATWFPRTRSFAIGIVASGASIAGLVYPVMTKFLIAKVGFNNAVRYVATVIAVTSILAVLIARPNPAHQSNKPSTLKDWRVFFDSSAFKNPSFVWLTASICFTFFGFYSVFFNLEVSIRSSFRCARKSLTLLFTTIGMGCLLGNRTPR